MGRLSPLDGIGPKEIRLDRLIKRATDGVVKEVVLATNFTNEGEATAHYIGELLAARGLKVSRLARGVPVGGELEYVDSGTLAQALRERRHALGSLTRLRRPGCPSGRAGSRRCPAPVERVDVARRAGINCPTTTRRCRRDRAPARRAGQVSGPLQHAIPGTARTTPFHWRMHDAQIARSGASRKPASTRLPPQVPEGCHRRCRRGRDARLPDDREGARPARSRCACRAPGRRRTSSTSTRSTTRRRSTT